MMHPLLTDNNKKMRELFSRMWTHRSQYLGGEVISVVEPQSKTIDSSESTDNLSNSIPLVTIKRAVVSLSSAQSSKDFLFLNIEWKAIY